MCRIPGLQVLPGQLAAGLLEKQALGVLAHEPPQGVGGQFAASQLALGLGQTEQGVIGQQWIRCGRPLQMGTASS